MRAGPGAMGARAVRRSVRSAAGVPAERAADRARPHFALPGGVAFTWGRCTSTWVYRVTWHQVAPGSLTWVHQPTWVALTWAPPTIAAWGSTTVPEIEPFRTCPMAGMHANAKLTATKTALPALQ